ncbi:MAG: hypothetical protein IIU55_07980 [Paludibacteraceae bacterium]|jgi:hypothetical protein|nr:hypothetical protein [Paludibacteraceae bacterium]
MKKVILVAILAVAGFVAVVAQPRAIGVNLGYGVDVSYQHSIGESNMIDLSVNIPAFNGIGVTATYDWINPFNTAIPWNEKGEWNWSLGVGAGVGVYNPFRTLSAVNEQGELVKEWAGKIYAGAVGHVGVEYNFWFPLQLSVDYRPNIGVAIASDGGFMFNGIGLFSGITLGVRYLF